MVARFGYRAALGLGLLYWLALLGVAASVFTDLGGSHRLALTGVVAAGLPVALLVVFILRRHVRSTGEPHAYRDALTGLPNRAYFMERLEAALARSQRSGRMVAVLFLDLDRFKLINDTLGHAAGDRLLIEVSRRLRRQVRQGETFSRVGGDEYTIVLEDLKSQDGAERTADRVLQALRSPLLIQGHDVAVSASLGLALNGGAQCSADELVRRADVALYQAKADGRDCWRAFRPDRSTASLERLEIDAGLRKAIENDELLLYFQPEIDLASGRTAGFEALVRWQHPSRGLLMPLAFIPSAEETGLIHSIGAWALRRACDEAMAWQKALPEDPAIAVSVNLSPLQFRDPQLVEHLEEVLRDTRLPPSRLKIEIVETALLSEGELTLITLHRIKQLGVRLAIDDFGTGYSSLSYLRRFPTDTLKLDRSFLTDSAGDERVIAIIESVVALAHALSMDVTAEGVETTQELSLLLRARCDRAQGYLFARPLSPDAVIPFLRRQQPIADLDGSRAA
jgi:diguanylate cyclase (GGDEF)-like protein